MVSLFSAGSEKRRIYQANVNDLKVLQNLDKAEIMFELKKTQQLILALYSEHKIDKETRIIQNELLTNLSTTQEMLLHSLEELRLIPSTSEDYEPEGTTSSASAWNTEDDFSELEELEVAKDKKRLN